VNPRFQGSLECVERVLGINLVDAHVKACLEGTLPLLERKRRTCCVRLILYTRQRSMAPDLNNLEEVRDIPLLGAVVEQGEPLCSVVSEGRTRGSALGKAMLLAHRIYAVTLPRLH
jgi:predicted ATP-grasp superfamily ATP-dependent carboligase